MFCGILNLIIILDVYHGIRFFILLNYLISRNLFFFADQKTSGKHSNKAYASYCKKLRLGRFQRPLGQITMSYLCLPGIQYQPFFYKILFNNFFFTFSFSGLTIQVVIPTKRTVNRPRNPIMIPVTFPILLPPP